MKRPEISRQLAADAGVISRLIAMATIMILASCSSGVSVAVTNAAQTPIASVRVEFTGGSTQMDDLQPGRTAKFKLHPTGESSAILAYRDASGLEHRCDLDIYEDTGFVDEVSAAITPTGCQKRR